MQSEDGIEALQADVGARQQAVGLPPLPPVNSDPTPVTVSISGTALQPCSKPGLPLVTTAAAIAESQSLQRHEAAAVPQQLDSRSVDAKSVLQLPLAAASPQPACIHDTLAAADSNMLSGSTVDLQGSSDTMANPSSQDLTKPGSGQSDNLSPATIRQAAHSVVPSPSLTSLAEIAYAAGSTNDCVAAEQSATRSGAAMDTGDTPRAQHGFRQLSNAPSIEGADSDNDITSPTATSGFRVTGFQVQATDSVGDNGERANSAVIPVLQPTAASRRRANYDTAVRTQSASEKTAASDEGQPASLNSLEHSAANAQQEASSGCETLLTPACHTLSQQLLAPHSGPDPQRNLAELSAAMVPDISPGSDCSSSVP